jgi:hypothetical protein
MALRWRSGRGLAAAAALLALAACDGDGGTGSLGGGSTGPDSFADMKERLDKLPDTPFAPPGNAIPNTGTAVFNGYMNVNITGAADPFQLTGITRITADFANSTLSGDATAFEAQRGTLVSTYGGTITFENGRIGRVGLTGDPNDVRLGYTGSLSAPASVVVLNGEAAGKLKGAPIQGLVAESAPGEVVRLNGTDAAARITIVAER